MNIVGQERLISTINKFNLDTFPRTFMLEGSKGSGKHTVANYIANRLNLDVIDITNKLDLETIVEITLKVHPCLYIIACNDLSVREENTILKLLEEPLKNTYIAILVENKSTILDTIINRCFQLKLEPYNKETLEKFLNPDIEDKDLVLSLSETPGDVISIQSYPLKDMESLCIKIFDKIGVANYANMLLLSKQIAFKNEKDKFDIDIFFKMLLMVSRDRSLNIGDKYYEYFITNDYYAKLKIKNIDKKHIFDGYLMFLKDYVTNIKCISLEVI